MAKIISITEHFQHFLSEMKESAICTDRRNWHGSDFSSCNRSENGTGFRAGGDTSVGEAKGATIATATMSGIS
jgi:hypothetical protein